MASSSTEDHRAPRDSLRKALFALLAFALPFALWHLAVVRRGSAYLFADPSRSPLLGLHLLAMIAAFSLAFRARTLPPWRSPALLLAFALAASTSLVGAFFAAASPLFPAFSAAVALALGTIVGALLATLWRGLSALDFDREAFFELLRVEALGLSLLGAVLYLLAAERLGPLRLGLLLSVGVAVTAHLGFSTIAPGAPASRRGRRAAAAACYLLAFAQVLVEPLTPLREASSVPDPVILARNAPQSRLVLTSGRGAVQLYVDALLRLSTIDAARRREAAAHPAMLAAPRRERVLLLGGGDGGALREILRYPDVSSVTVVEPEFNLADVAMTHPILLAENQGSLRDPRVRLLRQDPTTFLASSHDLYDVVLIDLLDPESPRRSKWYTRHFYQSVASHLAPDAVGGLFVAASPLAHRQAFWCVISTVEAAGLHALPYRANLPSLGAWGFSLFSRAPLSPPSASPPAGLLATSAETIASFFALAPDEQRVPVEVNLLHHQVLARYRNQGGLLYAGGWGDFLQVGETRGCAPLVAPAARGARGT